MRISIVFCEHQGNPEGVQRPALVVEVRGILEQWENHISTASTDNKSLLNCIMCSHRGIYVSLYIYMYILCISPNRSDIRVLSKFVTCIGHELMMA